MKKINLKPVLVTLTVFLCMFLTLDVSAIPVLTTPDSVGVKSIAGKKFIVHKIDKGESFYSIAKKYNISVKELEDANPDITDKITAGKILFVPVKETAEVSIGMAKQELIKQKDTVKKAVIKEVEDPGLQDAGLRVKPTIQTKAKPDTSSKPITPINKPHSQIKYTVKGGDNLGMIAGKYHTTVATIMKLNNLANDRINIGQVLVVGTETAQDNGKPDAIKDTSTVKIIPKKEAVKIKKDTSAIKQDSLSKKVEIIKKDSVKKADKASMSADYKTFTANNKPMKEFQEKGIAAWIDDEDVNPRKYFGLHKTAPIGTIIKVTNPMNNRYVFVKVVGTLPDTGDNATVIIKISKASAAKLEVLDAHFQAVLDFATNEY